MPVVASATPVGSKPVPAAPDARTQYRTARIIAIVAGLVGFILCVATPVLPVEQTTAELNWPQDGTVTSVDAPLISFVPLDLDIRVPCRLVADLPESGGVLVSTAPARGKDAGLNGLFIRADTDRVDITDRNVVLATASRSDVQAGACTDIVVRSDQTGTGADFEGIAGTNRFIEDPNLRPQIVGVFTELQGSAPADLRFHATIDTRFTSTPTLLKLLAMIVGVLATIAALVALARLDGIDGRKHRRFLPERWWRLKVIDGVVIFVLVLWHFIGSNTSDDGYLLTMARVSGHAGYMANYFRWFGVPEDPFGWYYQGFALMTNVSTAGPWMRLPALVAGIVCWLAISREVMPRLGAAIRRNHIAIWTAGMMFLAFWLPFNNGLRPEPIVAVGALLTWCSIERAIATGRLLPAAIAIIIAAFSLGAAPHGLIAVAAILAGARPILRIIVRRHRQVGTLALLAPMLAAGTVILTVIFADQTVAGVLEATQVRTEIGPRLDWWEELVRYYYLMLPTVDGSLSRRFAVLVMFLCLFTTVLMLLRKKRIPGTAPGPAWRLVGVVFGTIFFMTFTPTKWTHHFGVFAGIAAALAALTAVAVASATARSKRNLTLFTAALLFVLAMAMSGTNGWWYVSSYGIPWWNLQPVLGGIPVSTLVLAVAVLCTLIGAWQHFREDFTSEPKPTAERLRRIRVLASAPLTVIAAAMVLFEVLSFVKGAVSQYPSYSLARSNFNSLTGDTCALANDVLVESDPNDGILRPIGDAPDPLAGVGSVGFDPNGVPEDVSADVIDVKPGGPGTDNPSLGTGTAQGQSSGTGGGQGGRGINGSTVALPFGLNPATTPVLGSYRSGAQREALLTSNWYRLPEPSADAPLIVMSASGRVAARDSAGNVSDGQLLALEYGSTAPDGAVQPLGRATPYDIGPSPSWRNLRIPRSALPAGADTVRVVAEDRALASDQWLAFTPPRVPALRTLQEVVGSTDPVLLDWAVGLAFPCQQPMAHLDGVTEVPRFRISPDQTAKVQNTDTWQASDNGGLLGPTELLLSATTLPTYLRDDWDRDWGSLERYTPFVGSAEPARIDTGTAVRTGLWSPGHLRKGY